MYIIIVYKTIDIITLILWQVNSMHVHSYSSDSGQTEFLHLQEVWPYTRLDWVDGLCPDLVPRSQTHARRVSLRKWPSEIGSELRQTSPDLGHRYS